MMWSALQPSNKMKNFKIVQGKCVVGASPKMVPFEGACHNHDAWRLLTMRLLSLHDGRLECMCVTLDRPNLPIVLSVSVGHAWAAKYPACACQNNCG
jgi:hypothetical protein